MSKCLITILALLPLFACSPPAPKGPLADVEGIRSVSQIGTRLEVEVFPTANANTEAGIDSYEAKLRDIGQALSKEGMDAHKIDRIDVTFDAVYQINTIGMNGYEAFALMHIPAQALMDAAARPAEKGQILNLVTSAEFLSPGDHSDRLWCQKNAAAAPRFCASAGH